MGVRKSRAAGWSRNAGLQEGASTRASTRIHTLFNTQNSFTACAQVRCAAVYLRSHYYRHVYACSEPPGARTTLTRLQTTVYTTIYQLDYSACPSACTPSGKSHVHAHVPLVSKLPFYRHAHACSEPTGARTTLTRLQTLIYNAIYQLDYSA